MTVMGCVSLGLQGCDTKFEVEIEDELLEGLDIDARQLLIEETVFEVAANYYEIWWEEQE